MDYSWKQNISGYDTYGRNNTPWYYSRGVEGGIAVTFEKEIESIGGYMFYNCIGLNKIIYKNNEFTDLSSFQAIFVNTDGGTISSSAFSGSGF